MGNELTWNDLEEYKKFYLQHFGHETNLDQGRGSLPDYVSAIVEAISTNTPIDRFSDDLTNAET